MRRKKEREREREKEREKERKREREKERKREREKREKERKRERERERERERKREREKERNRERETEKERKREREREEREREEREREREVIWLKRVAGPCPSPLTGTQRGVKRETRGAVSHSLPPFERYGVFAETLTSHYHDPTGIPYIGGAIPRRPLASEAPSDLWGMQQGGPTKVTNS